MHKNWMLSAWVNRVILACALIMFLISEVVVIAACLRNGQLVFQARGASQLALNLFLTGIPLAIALGGCARVRRVQLRIAQEVEEASFVWLWRQYLVGTVFTYAVLISVITSVAPAFRPR
jgi:hypothetical protein